MMRVLLRSAAAILLIAMGFLFGPAASAQVQSPSPEVSQEPQNIPDQKTRRGSRRHRPRGQPQARLPTADSRGRSRRQGANLG